MGLGTASGAGPHEVGETFLDEPLSGCGKIEASEVAPPQGAPAIRYGLINQRADRLIEVIRLVVDETLGGPFAPTVGGPSSTGKRNRGRCQNG